MNSLTLLNYWYLMLQKLKLTLYAQSLSGYFENWDLGAPMTQVFLKRRTNLEVWHSAKVYG